MTQKSLHLHQNSQVLSKLTRNLREWIITAILFLAASSSVITVGAIILMLFTESIPFFQQISLFHFFTDREWETLFTDQYDPESKYGIMPLLSGTLITSTIALGIAIPLGTIAAIYLSEFASARLREIVKPCLELLAAIPTVVYGYFALLFITPLLQKLMPDLSGFNMLSAGLVMGLMITPFISSISEDAMRAVPINLREGSYATGATRLQTALGVVFPSAMSGLIASYILGASRAVGETMIVAIAAGLQPNLTLNPLDQGATITAYIC
jgi:phosphate transport system permease protein